MAKSPDFYIISDERRPIVKPRKCWIEKKIKSIERGDYFLLVQIEPYLYARDFNIQGIQEISKLIIASRSLENSLLDIRKPILVYACIIKNDDYQVEEISAKDLTTLFIGDLFLNYAEANDWVKRDPDTKFGLI
ncbi:MAG: hypothetical protein ABFC97_02490 [Anaerolineaceae bacterium]